MTTADVKARTKSLLSRRLPLSQPQSQLERLRGIRIGEEFDEALTRTGQSPYQPTKIEIFQVNVGKLCNQTCRHCHVDAGPDRTEVMTRETMEACLRALEVSGIPVVDITGGAPELNPDFRWFVQQCRALGRHVIDRCNLTILETPSHRDLPAFFADNQVEVVCSLPHFARLSTDRQRGDGVFEKSIRALTRLNEHGYGKGDPDRRLVLVTNPVGAFLPGDQAALEREWKRELVARHGVTFDSLFCITNMPISRYLEWLIESDNLDTYVQELVSSFNPAAASSAMCRNTISVGWDGILFDCDFNQMLDLPVALPGGPSDASASPHVRDFDFDTLSRRRIQTDRHCFGCTAGAGSSCGGSTAG
ncbi:MAG: arsenosugar biosynthesis radical SAM (seleno)protein ArsS [Sandaracinaceae bacterium]